MSIIYLKRNYLDSFAKSFSTTKEYNLLKGDIDIGDVACTPPLKEGFDFEILKKRIYKCKENKASSMMLNVIYT